VCPNWIRKTPASGDMVQKPLIFTVDDLKAIPSVSRSEQLQMVYFRNIAAASPQPPHVSD
jgi:hypothetical protein